MRTLACCLTLILAALLSACAPVTVSFTLFADESRLRETTVEADQGAEDAKVLMIDIRGLIADDADSGLLSRGPNPVDEITAKLKKAEQDPSVKAVILRINSPGGTVAASDMIFREIRGFSGRTGRPVVASFGELAASGGYYVALAADRIIAEPATITGSIGVIIPTVNVSEGLNRIGIHSRSIVSRPNKDLANPLEPIREGQYVVLQAIVDEFYGKFRSLVVERRGPVHQGNSAVPARLLDMSRLEELTDGRVITGLRAEEAGLVDSTGGIHDAFGVAKQLASIPRAKLVKYYREDGGRPRTAYAAAALPPADRANEFNLIQLRLGGGLLGLEHAGVYYVWLPPG